MHNVTKPMKYRDAEGNIYGGEHSVKTGRWIVIRTNPGGNRKLAKRFASVSCKRAEPCQHILDDAAKIEGWKEIGA